MTKKATGIVSYLTLIGWLIAYFVGDREGAKFHLNQSFLLVVANLVLTVAARILSKVPFIWIIIWICNIALFVLWIIGLIHAINEEEKPLPIIGGFQILK
ncbi:MAG: hypothetical protein IKR61_00570 [Lachnospiraceae bacterium]|nr:hypothetical protein [Lachnospiraceae bacterium]